MKTKLEEQPFLVNVVLSKITEINNLCYGSTESYMMGSSLPHQKLIIIIVKNLALRTRVLRRVDVAPSAPSSGTTPVTARAKSFRFCVCTPSGQQEDPLLGNNENSLGRR